MAANDWAIVVGVQWYPGLSDLLGPVNDAHAFIDWLENEGGVPSQQVLRVISEVPNPQFTNAAQGRPIDYEVRQTFDQILAVSMANEQQGLTARVGRRLYLYFSGHGYEPSLHLHPVLAASNTALLMANATRQQPGNHIGARAYADEFHNAGLFDEIAMFVDCCREVNRQSAPNPPHITLGAVPGPSPTVRFYGWGTQNKALSREKPLGPNGKVHGIFTHTLLDGLRGGAVDSQGQVTAASLNAYLYLNMQHKLTAQEKLDPDIPKIPDCYPLPSHGRFMVFATFPNGQRQVCIMPSHETPPPWTLDVLDGAKQPMLPSAKNATSWTYQLAPGYYRGILRDPGAVVVASALFEVEADINQRGIQNVNL